MRNVTPIRPRLQRRSLPSGITIAQYREIMAALRALPAEIADELERRGNVPPRCDQDGSYQTVWDGAPF